MLTIKIKLSKKTNAMSPKSNNILFRDGCMGGKTIKKRMINKK